MSARPFASVSMEILDTTHAQTCDVTKLHGVTHDVVQKMDDGSLGDFFTLGARCTCDWRERVRLRIEAALDGVRNPGEYSPTEDAVDAATRAVTGTPGTREDGTP